MMKRFLLFVLIFAVFPLVDNAQSYYSQCMASTYTCSMDIESVVSTSGTPTAFQAFFDVSSNWFTFSIMLVSFMMMFTGVLYFFAKALDLSDFQAYVKSEMMQAIASALMIILIIGIIESVVNNPNAPTSAINPATICKIT